MSEPEELKMDKHLLLYNKKDLFSFIRPDPPLNIAPSKRKDEGHARDPNPPEPIDSDSHPDEKSRHESPVPQPGPMPV